MKKFKFTDHWSYQGGISEKEIGIIESDTVENAIMIASKINQQVNPLSTLIKLDDTNWGTLGNEFLHWVYITQN